jgi:endonuclease-3
MQQGFDFASADLERWRTALQPLLEGLSMPPRRPPIGALVKSLISGRTRDAVSLRVYRHLCRVFPSPQLLARARPIAIERAIAEVTFPDIKARWLAEGLQRIGRERPDFDIDFLGSIPIAQGLAWLERLPGVGRKVAAATLNASRLARPVFIVDSHVLRVLQRLGFVAPHAEIRAASEQVTSALPCWSGDDFLRFHIATKRLGQVFCRPHSPDCAHCPLAPDCPSAPAHRLTRPSTCDIPGAGGIDGRREAASELAGAAEGRVREPLYADVAAVPRRRKTGRQAHLSQGQ